MPLADVARLEELAAGSIERAGDRDVVQYEGRLLPVVRLDEARDPSSPLTLVVHSADVGVIVGSIAEVVEQAVVVDGGTARRGTFGSAVFAGRVADVLDVPTLATAHLLGAA